MALEKMLLPASLVLGAILLASVLLFLLQPSPQHPAPSKLTGGAKHPAAASSAPFSEPAGFASQDADQPRSTGIAEKESQESGAVATDQLPPDTPMWESSVNAILESAEDNDAVALKLDALAHSLPMEGQVEATQHMVNLLGDESYQLARRKLANPATPREVMDVIYSDVLNRPNTVKLPALVDVLAVPGHPLHAESLETLRVFVERDLGNDLPAWNVAVQEFLREESRQESATAAQPDAP
jgi:hypothetical protein